MVLNFDSITSKVPAKVFLLFWGKHQYFCPRNQKRLSEKTRASLAFLFKILYFEDMGKDVVCVSYRLGLAWGQAEIEAVTAAEKGLSLAGSGRRAVVVWRSYQADLQEESSPVHCAAVQRVHAFSYTNSSTNLNTTDLAVISEFVSQKLIMPKHSEADLCDTCAAWL